MQKLQCILLVDDDQMANSVNRRLLEKMNVTDRLRVASTGQEVSDLLIAHGQEARADAPVLLFLDVKMLVTDGSDFLAAYQQLPLAQREAIIIIMLTTVPGEQWMEQFPIAGFLTKPLTAEKVSQVLKTHFAWE